MNLLGTDIPPLGMGGWPIGGPFFRGEQPLGYANAEDGMSIRTIHAALDAGIRLFDTAAVYGAGHSERLLGQALKRRPEALVITKIGLRFDEATKQLLGEEVDPNAVGPAIDRCLKRLDRDCIDVLLLHPNDLSIAQAGPIFDQMALALEVGKIRSFGWSTDFPDRAVAMAGREGFVGVQHAMNVFFDVPTIQGVVEQHALTAFIRSPLAMGLLTGKFDANSVLPSDDIRSTNEPWRGYFTDAKVEQPYLDMLDALRDLLQTDGRTLSQGALCWLMAKSPRNIPLPGARTVAQIQDNAGALDHGPLPSEVMAQIEAVMKRPPEELPRAR